MNSNTHVPRSTRRKTTDIFKREIYSFTDGEFTVVGEYKNNKTLIEILHNRCNHVFKVIPNRFRNKCPYCDNRMHYTQETLSSRVKEITNGEYGLVGGFTKSKEKAKFIHYDCGSVFNVIVNDFLEGKSRCKICRKKREKSENQVIFGRDFSNNIKKKFNGNIEVVSDYMDSKSRMKFRCVKHNDIFESQPNSLLTNTKHGCKKCREENRPRKFTKQEVKSYLSETNIRLLSPTYKTTTDNLNFLCLECGREFESCMHTIMRCNMKRCKGCSINATNKKDVREIKRYIEENTTATLLTSDYNNNVSKLNLLCECGETFQTSWLKIKERNQTRCSKCSGSISNAEYKTMMYLSETRVSFKREYRFGDLRNDNGGYYRFDFAVFNDTTGEIETLIELDGQQHYEPVELWGGIKTLNKTQHNDFIKNRYCEINNISLIRIPYWDFDNIDEILKNKLKFEEKVTQ